MEGGWPVSDGITNVDVWRYSALHMDRSRFCGCKGIRSCLLCEKKFNLEGYQDQIISQVKEVEAYSYCMHCDLAYQTWNEYEFSNHPNHTLTSKKKISGIFIMLDFLSEPEESRLIKALDSMRWDISQSGRRKQNFGPACNFKKRKLKLGTFRGFPAETKFVQDKFKTVSILEDYQTIEQCSLEYDPNRGASIDPHIDDCWIWGERIVSVNLLADSVLILTKYRGDEDRYNLDLVADKRQRTEDICLRIPMPRRSLLVLFGDARYNWEHCILREDIKERRICLAYREFTKPYLAGGKFQVEGDAITQVAQNFY